MDASPRPFTLVVRCSGPNCGIHRSGNQEGWWLLWTSLEEKVPVLSLAPWSDELAVREGAVFACGENCAHKLQSTFMSNVMTSRAKSSMK